MKGRLPEGIDQSIWDERVRAAMREVPRDAFVPEDLRHRAFDDCALPIGHGQTISQPYVVAFMTQSLELEPTDRVLEIGTGCGYQAAVLSRLVQEVYSIEIIEPLASEAATILRGLGYNNIHLRMGDGHQGWLEAAPFDAIIVTCAPESVPPSLVDQLKDGGRMIIPVGERGHQKLVLLTKTEGRLEQRQVMSVSFVPMTGDEEYAQGTGS